MGNEPQIKAQLAMRPFRPFSLETTGGNRIRISRPDWFFEPPNSRGEFVVFDAGLAYVLNYDDILGSIVVETPSREQENGNGV